MSRRLAVGKFVTVSVVKSKPFSVVNDGLLTEYGLISLILLLDQSEQLGICLGVGIFDGIVGQVGLGLPVDAVRACEGTSGYKRQRSADEYDGSLHGISLMVAYPLRLSHTTPIDTSDGTLCKNFDN